MGQFSIHNRAGILSCDFYVGIMHTAYTGVNVTTKELGYVINFAIQSLAFVYFFIYARQ
ncbi:hypothetical protein ALT785_690038 [Alteromonas infernus]